MDLHLDVTAGPGLTAAIYRQVREAVLDGRLGPGERLPATRELAVRLAVSRNTVAAAYELLTAEGFVESRIGAGTFVAAAAAESAGRRERRRAPRGAEIRPRPVWAAMPAPRTETSPAFDLRVGTPDARLFPLTEWRRLVARELRPDKVTSGYADPAGHALLRAAIARHAGASRAVRADADDVIVTQGAQQALDLVGRILIDPGSTVVVEEPGYPPTRQLFQSLGGHVVGVPVDAEGLVVDAIPEAARLVYVTPSHQFPLGMVMSLARRRALLAWAERRRGAVIEDDYDAEFRFEGRPLESLQGMDRRGHTIYVGSFSKTLVPMLRLGFLVAPGSLRPALLAAKRLTDWQGDLPSQGALAALIEHGRFAGHVRSATRVYARRRDLVLAALEHDFADWLEIVHGAAGLHVCALLRGDDRIALARALGRARMAGVAVESLTAYHAEGRGRAGIAVGYGSAAEPEVAEGLRRLAASFRAASWYPQPDSNR